MPTTVMIVEDEPNIGALVRTYLERAGYQALWVRSGEDALTELRRYVTARASLLLARDRERPLSFHGYAYRFSPYRSGMAAIVRGLLRGVRDGAARIPIFSKPINALPR